MVIKYKLVTFEILSQSGSVIAQIEGNIKTIERASYHLYILAGQQREAAIFSVLFNWRFFMFQQETCITIDAGLYSYPAQELAKAANMFKSEITVTFNGKVVNAKDFSAVDRLSVPNGAMITISAKGEDEQKAVERLVALLEIVE